MECKSIKAKLTCAECPWSKDVYPEKRLYDVPFRICGMTGNTVFPVPHREKKACGSGYLHFPVSSCGIWESAEEVLEAMTEPERKRWKNENEKQSL